ncbi:MAG: hypothetical protein MZV65_31345 [Chromatiales bacterium]|nr:hypothetical protein [Chromatiales bacterium]
MPAERGHGHGPDEPGLHRDRRRAAGWVEGNQANGIYRYTFAQSLQGRSPTFPTTRRCIAPRRPRDPPASRRRDRVHPGQQRRLHLDAGDRRRGRRVRPRDRRQRHLQRLPRPTSSFHGGARFDLQYCAMCHEPYLVRRADRQLDRPQGDDPQDPLGDIAADAKPAFYGDLRLQQRLLPITPKSQFTQDQRNCQTCHQESDTDTPQASNWRLTVNREACGSCHDNVNFATGAGHGGVAGDGRPVHRLPRPELRTVGLRPDQRALRSRCCGRARSSSTKCCNVVNTRAGPEAHRDDPRRPTRPTATRPYDIKAAGGPFQIGNASLRGRRRVLDAAGLHQHGQRLGDGDHRHAGAADQHRLQGERRARPGVRGRGSRRRRRVAIPAGATGSGSALLEGRPNVRIDTNGDGVARDGRGAVVASRQGLRDHRRRAGARIGRSWTSPSATTATSSSSLHGENRTGNAELCATCHNPNATDINRRVAGSNCEAVTGTLDDQTIDFKVHGARDPRGRDRGYKVCGYGNTGYDFSYVRYPGKLNNCEGCHLPDTYYPPDPTTALATTIDAAPASSPDRSTPLGDIAIDAGDGRSARPATRARPRRQHMRAERRLVHARSRTPDSTTPRTPAEACANLPRPGPQRRREGSSHGVGRVPNCN